MKSIYSLNENIVARIKQSRQTKSGNKPLTLLHFSDIHGEERILKRITDFANHRKIRPLLDDVVFTGDASWTSSIKYGCGFWMKNRRARKFLLCLGNHDVIYLPNGTSIPGGRWKNTLTEEDQCAIYIDPCETYWKGDIDHPPLKTYYRKIYPEQKIMLIVLNTVLLDEKKMGIQLDFFKKWLDEALSKNLAVICASHSPCADNDVVRCSFTDERAVSRRETEKDWENMYEWLRPSFLKAIDDFSHAGGTFICHLCGHIHCPSVRKSVLYPGQLFIMQDCAYSEKKNITFAESRVRGERCEDCFGIVTIDVEENLIKLIRVGRRYNFHGSKASVMALNYKTGEIY